MTAFLRINASAMQEFLDGTRELIRLAEMVDDFAELRAVAARVKVSLENAQISPTENPCTSTNGSGHKWTHYSTRRDRCMECGLERMVE